MSFFSSFFKDEKKDEEKKEEITKEQDTKKEEITKEQDTNKNGEQSQGKNQDSKDNYIMEKVENKLDNIENKLDNIENKKDINIDNKDNIIENNTNNIISSDPILSANAPALAISTASSAPIIPSHANNNSLELNNIDPSKRTSIPDIHNPNSMIKSTGVLPMSLAPNTPLPINDTKVVVPPLNIAAAAAITKEEMKPVTITTATTTDNSLLMDNNISASINPVIDSTVNTLTTSNLVMPPKASNSARSEFIGTDIFNIKISDKLPLDEQLKQVTLQIETLDKCFQNVEISQELYTSHFARLNEKKIEIQDLQAKKYAEKRAREEAERELEELKNNPDYAPYYERFVLFDTDKSGSIELTELCALVQQCGYFFSDNLMSAIMKIYFPESPVLDFKDFIRLMQFVLGDLDIQLRDHLKPSIEASEFKNFENEQAMQELLSLINYDDQISNYDFKAAELRLAELVAYDRSLTVSKQVPADEMIEKNNSNEVDKFGFDSNDEEFLSSCFIQFLKAYAPPKAVQLQRSDIAPCLRSMGLQPSDNDLNQLFAVIDPEGYGKIEYKDFKQYYHPFWTNYLITGFNIDKLVSLFRSFDLDGSGDVSIDEFKHIVVKLCPKIKYDDLEYIVKIIDVSDDKRVEIDEFIDFIEQDDQLSRSVRKRLIRASLLPVTDYLAAFNKMPSTFRVSTLSTFAEKDYLKPSFKLTPKLNADGFSWNDFAIDQTGAIREAIDDTSPLTFQLDLELATGVPITIDPNVRRAIKARIARVCLFDDDLPISNVITSLAQWSDEEEDYWRFNVPVTLEWNKILLKTKKKQTKLYIELNILVQADLKMDDSKTLVDNHATQNSVEICCAVGCIDIVKEEWLRLNKSTRITVPLKGGSIKTPVLLKPEEVLTRRSGFKSVFASNKTNSEIIATVTPLNSLPDRSKIFASQLPLEFLSLECAIRSIRLYRELLADSLLRSDHFEYTGAPPYLNTYQPLNIRLRQNAPLQVFLSLVDHQDMLFCFSNKWEDRRNEVKDRKDDKGKANKEVKTKFADAILEMMPVLYSASLPDEKIGENTISRIERINYVLKGKLLDNLNNDSLSFESVGGREVKDKNMNIYAPFACTTLLFDPFKNNPILNY